MMFDVSRVMKFGFAIATVSLLAASPSYADTGSIRLHATKAGFIVGVGGGTGTLTFHGKTYPLSVGGMSVGTIGVAGVDVVGRAYNMRRPQDIVGTYTAVGASVAVAGGAAAARLQNANGVILEVRGKQVGFEASLNLGGISISMR
jgi:hypothetical protein